ncbi:hypothetical protein EBT16_00495 [bacterium]|nr:hypothetical protein [bacterium]
MGYLTTFTIYNDGIDSIRDNAQEFADKLYEAASGGGVDIAIGSFCNLVKVQKARHADDHTVYMHMGNTVCEMNAYSKDTLKTMMQHPAFFEKMLDEMARQCRMLKKQLKEYKEEKNAANSNR